MNAITKKKGYMLIAIVCLFLISGCKKENNSALDLTGTWQYYATRNDSPQEEGPFIMEITQNGNELTATVPVFYVSGTGVINGNTINWTYIDTDPVNPNNVYSIGTIIDRNHMEGTWSEDGPFTGTWRAERM